MQQVALGEVVRIDRTPATDADCRSLPYVGLEHIEKDIGRFASDYDGSVADMLATQFRFTSEHVLYGKLRPYLNKVALPNFDGVCTTEILPLLPKSAKLDRTYLWAMLLSPKFVEWASNNVSGANLPRLAPSLLAAYPIPLPPLAEQQRIAGLLRRADRLRRLRRYALAVSAGYLQAVFVEMFGDPASNPKQWKREYIGDVLRDTQYGTSEKSNQERRGYPVLGMANITYSGNLALENLSYVELDDREYRTLRLQPGDIIFNRTNSTELVGKTAHWNLTIDAVLASYLVKLQLVDRITPDYFTALLNTPYYKLLFQGRCKKAVGQSNISPTLLKEFPMLSPPVNLQEEYGLIVAKHRRLQLQQEEALRQTEHLFQALLWRAFV